MSKKKGLYKTNKEAKVHTIIECPVCHTKFEKIQWSQAFCCTQCKDKFHNMRNPDRHRYSYDYSYDVLDDMVDSDFGEYFGDHD